jgi:3D-(3,5/4)-trihydroxycyclohexane-1,2-dione acylhydrolase (decyclizing)
VLRPSGFSACRALEIEDSEGGFRCGHPNAFFGPRCWRIRRPPPDPAQLADAADALSRAQAPLIIAGGGVHYALACDVLSDLAARHGVPVAETQSGKGALAWDHPCAMGAIGVTGGTAANARSRPKRT